MFINVYEEKEMRKCIYCSRITSEKDPGVSLHLFPLKNEELLEKWVQNIGFKNFTPHKNNVLCSKHFTEDCFERSLCHVSLKKNSVPTIFGEPVAQYCLSCKAKRSLNSDRCFYKFPLKNKKLLQIWLKNMGREDVAPNESSLICSKHFETSCFCKSKTRYAKLMADAVPTIFNFDNDTPSSSGSNFSENITEQTTTNPNVNRDEGVPISVQSSPPCRPNQEINEDVTMDESNLLCSKHSDTSCFCNSKTHYAKHMTVASPTVINSANDTPTSSGSNFSENITEQSTTNLNINRDEEVPMSVESSSPHTPNRGIEAFVRHDHYYDDSPKTVKKKLIMCKEELKRKDHRLNLHYQKIARLERKVSTLTDIIAELRNSKLVSESCLSSLDSIPDAGVRELWQRVVKNNDSSVSRAEYPPALRSFALTLHFYSPRAYEYVREKMYLALPASSTIRAWYMSIDGEAGFTSDSFEALKAKVKEARTKNKTVLCSFMLDEMGLKKGTQITRDGKVRGHVDFGGELGDENLREAKNALVFMVVGLDGKWKLPIAYFLIDGLNSETESELVKTALIKLHEVGVKVVSITFDGTNEHKCMANRLGANFNATSLLRPFFPHPITKDKIYVVFDACHMLKLIRNTFGDWKVILDTEGNRIEWRYVEQLAQLQENEGFRLANKLRLTHIAYLKMKMKVRLAAQTLSSSVADSLEFCMNELQLKEFQGCEATVKFIRNIDMVFDFLNSRNPYGKGFKSPLRRSNEHIWRPRIEKALVYISNLKSLDGKLLLEGRRKMGFLGLITASRAIILMYEEFVAPDDSVILYLLTYKLSQDHLELFFCAIRLCGGWCPNPTCLIFISAYKKLLIRHEISASNGNAEAQDETSILTVSSGALRQARLDRYDPKVYTEIANTRVAKKYNLDETDDTSTFTNAANTEFPRLLLPEVISVFSRSAVAYIAGWIVRKVWNKIKCETCRLALVYDKLEIPCFDFSDKSSDDPGDFPSYSQAVQLIQAKSNGGLLFPSLTVYKIAILTEQFFRHAINCNAGSVPTESNFPAVLLKKVLTEFFENPRRSRQLFPDLDDHIFDDDVEDISGHIYTLTKSVTMQYIDMRMFALSKICTLRQTGLNLRHYTNRQLIWKNQ